MLVVPRASEAVSGRSAARHTSSAHMRSGSGRRANGAVVFIDELDSFANRASLTHSHKTMSLKLLMDLLSSSTACRAGRK
jgi:hypothetical protein